MIRRTAAAAGAVLIAALFAVGVRQSSSLTTARDRLDDGRADARTAMLLDHARFLNPDPAVDVQQARFHLRQGRMDRVRSTLLDVVRQEPANAEAWGLIALGFRELDPALAERADAEVERLVPRVPEP